MANGAARRVAADSQPEWLTLGQAATYVGVAQSTMRKWTDSGQVASFKTPGRHRRYRRDDLDQSSTAPGAASRPPPDRSC